MRNSHMTLRSGNPVLSAKTFSGNYEATENVMTIDGTVNKTIISLLILLTSGVVTYVFEILAFMIIGFLVGLVLVIVTIFKPQWSP